MHSGSMPGCMVIIQEGVHITSIRMRVGIRVLLPSKSRCQNLRIFWLRSRPDMQRKSTHEGMNTLYSRDLTGSRELGVS